jgi:hypothetical protein
MMVIMTIVLLIISDDSVTSAQYSAIMNQQCMKVAVGVSGPLRAHERIIVKQDARVPNALQYALQNSLRNFIVLQRNVQGDHHRCAERQQASPMRFGMWHESRKWIYEI